MKVVYARFFFAVLLLATATMATAARAAAPAPSHADIVATPAESPSGR